MLRSALLGSSVAAFSAGETPTGDADFHRTVFLLTGEGAAATPVVEDTSGTAKSITWNGDVRVSPDNPIGTTASGSMVFDGSGDYLSVADHADWSWDGAAAAVRLWFKVDSISGSQALFGQYSGTTGNNGIELFVHSSGVLRLRILNGGSAYDVDGSTTLVADTWYHVALTKNASDQWAVWVDGVEDASTTRVPTASPNSFAIAARSGGDDKLSGAIFGFEVVKGAEVYTEAFSPPTSLPDAHANSVLRPFVNRVWIDESARAQSVHIVGNTSIAADASFSAGTAFDFDGSSGVIITDVQGWDTSADWVMEFEFELDTVSGVQILAAKQLGSYPFSILVDGSTLGVDINGSYSGRPGASGMTTGTLYKLALTYTDITNSWELFLDGVSKGTYEYSQPSTSEPLYIGQNYLGSGRLNGRIGNFRITQGTTRSEHDTPWTEVFSKYQDLSSNLTLDAFGDACLKFNTDFATTVKLWGAGGSAGYNSSSSYMSPGGCGGYATAALAFEADKLYLASVGEGGKQGTVRSFNEGGAAASANRGAGGGYTAIFKGSLKKQEHTVILAGGGGGAGNASVTSPTRYGGAGGGSSGDAAPGVHGGIGGSQVSGGASNGAALYGGNGTNFGGGGGGGYYGGGGSRGYDGGNVDGGGGGSSFIGHSDLSGASTEAGTNGDAPGGDDDPDYISDAGLGGQTYLAGGQDGAIIVKAV